LGVVVGARAVAAVDADVEAAPAHTGMGGTAALTGRSAADAAPPSAINATPANKNFFMAGSPAHAGSGALWEIVIDGLQNSSLWSLYLPADRCRFCILLRSRLVGLLNAI
jgi:hypothetical protein